MTIVILTPKKKLLNNIYNKLQINNIQLNKRCLIMH